MYNGYVHGIIEPKGWITSDSIGLSMNFGLRQWFHRGFVREMTQKVGSRVAVRSGGSQIRRQFSIGQPEFHSGVVISKGY